MPEWKGLLLPASRGERPIIDGGRTPVAYSNPESFGHNSVSAFWSMTFAVHFKHSVSVRFSAQHVYAF